ncbi:MAG TPA: cytochrome b/b6 domain-containing protein [Mariprofundaceae bacterium]|nr:cytochrome b/b6 domain-containing protein [Mariprofundaceae bacterium]
MGYDRPTRWLHAGLALAIPLQLLSESFMRLPKLGRIRTSTEAFFFTMHEWIGLAACAIVVLHILWSAFGTARGGFARLFPYMSAEGRKAIIKEIQEIPGWLSGKLHETAEESALAGTVHGLGLLLVLGMAITGTVVFFGMDELTGRMSPFVHAIAELHGDGGNLVWAYLIGHVGMVALHKIKGHNLLPRISPLARD